MAVKVVLNGGIKSCCSVTPPDVVQNALRSWLPESEELIMIDKEKEEWKPEGLALVAEEYFQGKMYPLLYINDTLAMIGGIPNRNDLLAIVSGKMEFGISEKEIIEAAKAMGYAKE